MGRVFEKAGGATLSPRARGWQDLPGTWERVWKRVRRPGRKPNEERIAARKAAWNALNAQIDSGEIPDEFRSKFDKQKYLALLEFDAEGIDPNLVTDKEIDLRADAIRKEISRLDKK